MFAPLTARKQTVPLWRLALALALARLSAADRKRTLKVPVRTEKRRRVLRRVKCRAAVNIHGERQDARRVMNNGGLVNNEQLLRIQVDVSAVGVFTPSNVSSSLLKCVLFGLQ